MFEMICYTIYIYQCYTEGHEMAIIQEHYSYLLDEHVNVNVYSSTWSSRFLL